MRGQRIHVGATVLAIALVAALAAYVIIRDQRIDHPTPANPPPIASSHLERQRVYNEHLAAMLTKKFEDIAGRGRVVVISNAELGRGKQSDVVLRNRLSVVVDSSVDPASANAVKDMSHAIMGGNAGDSFSFTQAPLDGARKRKSN